MSTANFLLQLCTSLGSVSLMGFLFWNLLNNRFKFLENTSSDNKARIKELELKNEKHLSRDDHRLIRMEDKEGIEKQIYELKKEIRAMPQEIATLVTALMK